MHERRQNQTSHYSRQNLYFLSIDRAMEQNQILQVMSSKGKAFRVHIAPPQGWSGTLLKGECVLCCIFTYKRDRS